MFGLLFPGQFQQVLEGELAVDLGLGIPPPPRYHARVTLAADRDDDWRSSHQAGSVCCRSLGAS